MTELGTITIRAEALPGNSSSHFELATLGSVTLRKELVLEMEHCLHWLGCPEERFRLALVAGGPNLPLLRVWGERGAVSLPT